MTDYLYLLFKVGDQKSAMGLKDGMCVCYIDPDDPNYSKWVPSPHTKKVFAIAKVPRSSMVEIVDMLLPNQDEDKIDLKTYRARKKLVDFSEWESTLSIPGLDTALRGSGTVEILDFTKKSLLLKSSDTLNVEAVDRNAISSGSYTVGSGGGDDYATWNAAFSDFANFDGDLTLTQTSDVTETGTNVTSENKGGYTLLLTSNSTHSGNPNNGWVITKNHAGTMFNLVMPGAGVIEIKDLHMATIGGGPGQRFILIGNGAVGTAKIHDNLLDNKGYRMEAIRTDTGTPIVEVWNNVIWDVGAIGWALRFTAAWNVSNKVENNTIYGCVTAIDNQNLAVTYTNCTLFGNTTNFENNTNSTSEYCATDKANVGAATDNNEQVNLTVADEVVSTDDTNANFMKVKYGGSCYNRGTAPSITENTTGIRNTPRPHGTDYSIGADEYALSISIPVTMLQIKSSI